MAFWEEIFIWIAIVGYALSFLLFMQGLIFKKVRSLNYGFVIICVAVAFQTVAIIARWYATGHIPVMHTYENSLVGSWSVIVTYLILRFLFPPAQSFAVVVTPLTLLILGNGLMVGGELQPLEPAFRSNWLVIHVLFNWFAFGAYVTAFAAGITYLLKERATQGFMSRLPELKLLEELSLRLIMFGFFTHAIGIASGAIWAHSLWGRYWGWDPLETWSLICWLMYGINLHLRVTLGWRGRMAAWLAIVSMLAVLFAFFGFGHGSSIHTQMMGR